MNFNSEQRQFDEILTFDTGELDRPFDCHWSRPRVVELGNFNGEDVLRWLPAGQECSPGRGMLEGFIRLFEKTSEGILEYAKRWGVLGICEEHAFPTGHGCPSRGGPRISVRHAWKYSDAELLSGQDGDPILAWRQFSEAANSVLRIHAHLNARERPEEELWKLALRPGPHPAFRSVLGDVDWSSAPWWNREFDVQCLTDLCINRWMRYGGVHPQLDPRNGSIRFTTDGLFGAIAVQLLLIVGGSDGWVICSNPECWHIYPSPRKPKAGQRHFCPGCRRTGVPKKFADRAYASRRRGRSRGNVG
jgi:hypothetical protein